MSSGSLDPVTALRARGLRVTPQRRAILQVFEGAPDEHLSADAIHARASRALPELSRGTVYASLAELSEIGLLRPVGRPDPVRYELRRSEHDHFRCRRCLRLRDIEINPPALQELEERGFVVERVEVVAEGLCVDCIDFAAGLGEGRRAIVERGPANFAVMSAPDLACAELDTPVGRLVLAATRPGLVRVAYADHADVPLLDARMRDGLGGRAARRSLAAALESVAGYFEGLTQVLECPIDWASLPAPDVQTLRAVVPIPYGELRSYVEVMPAPAATARDAGRALGSNPIPVVVPCHRVNMGRDLPPEYVGGTKARLELRALERNRAIPAKG